MFNRFKSLKQYLLVPLCLRGFTLIEIMVSIAVIVLLLSLLLPAVQNIRETSRRSVCQNNLRQIGLALHQYHESHRVLPPGSVQSYLIEPQPAGWGWGSLILPHLEQSALYDKIDFSVVTLASNHQDLFDVEFPTWRCPSDSNPSIASIQAGMATFESFIGNYTGNEALFKPLSSVSFKNITDGLHQSILAGEMRSYLESPSNSQVAHWAGELNDGVYTYANFTPFLSIDEYSPINQGISGAFSSWHAAGSNFVFCDGAVRFLSDTIDVSVYQSLGTIDQGDTVGEF